MWLKMWTITIGQVFFVLFCICSVEGVTPTNPCDPIQYNVTVKFLLGSGEVKDMMVKYHINPSWFVDPLIFVDCRRRGLASIPQAIPDNVQILDLSSNVINQVLNKDMKRFQDLQALWLYSNCIGESSVVHFYCTKIGAYDRNAFSSLINLKLLDIGGNAFDHMPSDLPPSLEYFDISRAGLKQIMKKDINYLKNLTVFVARNMCFFGNCSSTIFSIEKGAFENTSLNILELSENVLSMTMTSQLCLDDIVYVNIEQTHITRLAANNFDSLSAVVTLYLHLLNPGQENLHVIVENGTFDKLSNLEQLDLSCNLIEFLPNDIFQYNDKLSYLDLSGNCLYRYTLDPVLVPPRNMTHLYMGYNCCRDLSSATNITFTPHNLGPSFQNMTNLEHLDYGKPQRMGQQPIFSQACLFHLINNESINAIQNLPHLLEFLMSGGFVTEVDLTVLTELSHLTLIDLSSNKISNISSIKPKQTSKLKHLGSFRCLEKIKLVLPNNLLTKLKNTHLIHPGATHLNLSYNLLSTTPNNLFKNMPCLESIDLRHNPLQFIHERTFHDLENLEAVYLSSTYVMTMKNAVYFLQYFRPTSLYVQLSLMNNNLFQFLYFKSDSVKADAVTQADLSNNQVFSKLYLQQGLRTFRHATSLKLRNCEISFSTFSLPTPMLKYLDLSENGIEIISSQMLESVHLIEILLLSNNFIKVVSKSLFNVTNRLQHLDLSHNLISRLSADGGENSLPNLRRLELQNNYIYEIDPEIFPEAFLSQLDFIDLRYNSIECSCDLSENFGRWLSQRAYYLSDRPGILPRCSYSVGNFGGCVKCTTAKQEDRSLLQQSLLQYSTNNFCSSITNIIYTASFTTFYLLFTLVGLFVNSRKGMLWMAKFATRRVRSSSGNVDAITSSNFVFHGFVIYDTSDQEIGDWIDKQLVPNLNPKSSNLRVEIVERDDQCGFAPVQQLLFKIRASRKVIVVLSKNYGQSNQGKYVLSVLETLRYQTGNNRAVIVTFENDLKARTLLRRQRKEKPWSRFQFPDDERDWSMFWESLRSSLTSL